MEKPYKSYNGGKESDGTYQKIINVMPVHDIYIEPFLGNGAIYRHKLAALVSSIGIDLDSAVIKQWGKLSIPGLTLLNTDAIQWLENFIPVAAILKSLGIRVLIYLDPTYPKDTWKSNQDMYKHVLTDSDHTRLLNVAGSIQANIIISSYPNKKYDDALNGWNNITFQSTTRGGLATEKLWFNYDTPDLLHDYRYLGDNYRERELIKSRIKNTASKINRMPAAERNAILGQIEELQATSHK